MRFLFALILSLVVATAQTSFILNHDTASVGGGEECDAGTGTISFVGAGTAVEGTTSVTPSYPAGLAAGDYLIIATVSRGAFATSGGGLTGAWFEVEGGSGGETANSGTVYTKLFFKISDGTETGTETVSSVGGMVIARIFAYRSTTGFVTINNAAGSRGPDNSPGTSWSITGELLVEPNPPFEACETDVVLVFSGINLNVSSAFFGSPSLTVPGASFSGATERTSTATSAGNNGHLFAHEFSVSSGSGSGAPVFSTTTTSSGATWPAGASVFLRLRSN